MASDEPVVPPSVRSLDAATLKAFAHPFRLRLFNRLEQDGPATATQLAQRLDHNTGVTSYHLRELARHGLIEDAPGHGRGKERWWRVLAGGFALDTSEFRHDPDTAGATELLLASVVQQRGDELARWLAESRTAGTEWTDASVLARRTLVLSRAELARLVHEVTELLAGYTALALDREPADDTARVIVHFDAFPTGVGSPED